MSHFCTYLPPIVFLEWHILKCVSKSQNICIIVFIKFFHFAIYTSNIEFTNSNTVGAIYFTNGLSILKIVCDSKEDISSSIFPRIGHRCKRFKYLFN